ncbi:hypothetical protein B9Z55_013136 [Caenorhabditis nigoni]|uniref:F-box domain-containing protein n=1 Tax=Caenorhabditis nigoni TaxID=1611254 RepID=A0A2G5U0B0_9PELO|nr:hypothetical protein B9Z55_013136 [Caenorhabditis nigoni]
MFNRFPILRIPLVVFTEVVAQLDPAEIVSMSLCSKRSLNILKSNQLKNSRNWELEMLDQDDNKPNCPRVVIFLIDKCRYLEVLSARSISDLKSQNPQFVNIGSHRVPAAFHKGLLQTYWEDRVQGLKAITDYTSSLFSLPVSNVTIYKNSLWMFEWVSKRQTVPLKKVFWWTAFRKNEDFWDDEVFSSAMRQCSPTNKLYILSEPSVNYRLTERLPKVNEIEISKAGWITLDNLMSIDSIEICIDESQLSTVDITKFLKNWLAGGMPRMEYIIITSKNFNELEVFDEELQAYVVPIEEKRKYQKNPFGFEFEFVGGYSMQRKDGIKATINFRNGSFHMAKWND